jgi:acetyl esterase/lipase
MEKRIAINPKRIGQIGTIISAITILVSIIYMIVQSPLFVFDMIPFLYLISLLCGLFAILQQLNDHQSLVRNNKWLFWVSLLSLPLFILTSLNALFANFLMGSLYDRSYEFAAGLYFMLYAAFLTPLLLSGLYLFLLGFPETITRSNPSTAPISVSSKFGLKKSNLIRVIILCYSLFLVCISVFFASMLFFGTVIPVHSITGIFIPNFSLYYIPMFSAGLILFRLTNRFPNKKLVEIITLIGIISTSLFLLPIASLPVDVQQAEKEFSDAFGQNWRSRIGPETEPYFLKSPVHLNSYFLAEKEPQCTVIENVLFYEGNDTIERGLKLYFDAYIPKAPGIGNYSTLIRIHGGAWILGDKGQGNMLEVNKYFAAQGYVVFDVQYGIFDTGSNIPITPSNTLGNYTIDDMVRHLGEFTKFLSLHASNFSANLNSTFISGNSAGGHLALTLGLAISNGSMPHLFGTGIVVKGIIPYYPANGLSKNVLPDSNTIFNDGLNFITPNSPPILIFHGKQDGLVKPSISEQIKTMYRQQGITESALIWWTFSGHAGDLHYYGPYSQIGLYYAERFMYLYK